ncbi:MAG: type II CRISPR-associated endonuclease Cas1 [Candidatus Melainabacteria bacterium]
MSFHILTISSINSWIHVDRGFLVCKTEGQEEKRIPLADVRALVLTVPQVSFSNHCLARLLEQDSIVLHCSEDYKPIGWTVPMDRVIRKAAFENQIKQDQQLEKALWERVIKQKIQNQFTVLEIIGCEHKITAEKLDLIDEATMARKYWNNFFGSLGKVQNRERKGANSIENKALNYGYAVLTTLVHRAILIHGLLPSLGIHHENRYRNTPLVWDLVEPLRPFVDLFLFKWYEKNNFFIDEDASLEDQMEDDEIFDFKEWIVFMTQNLRFCRLKDTNSKHTAKLMDAVDDYIMSISKAFEEFETLKCKLPDLKQAYFHAEKVE